MVLTPRRWRQVLEKQASQGRQWQESPVTGESAKQTVKTTARGMPDVSGVTVVTNARVYYTPRAAADAPSVRHSLRPLLAEGGKSEAKLARNMRRDREAMPRRHYDATMDDAVAAGAIGSAHLTNFWHCGYGAFSFRTGHGSPPWQRTVNGFGRESGFQKGLAMLIRSCKYGVHGKAASAGAPEAIPAASLLPTLLLGGLLLICP